MVTASCQVSGRRKSLAEAIGRAGKPAPGDDGFGVGELEAHFVRSSPQDGLDEHAAALIELLGSLCR